MIKSQKKAANSYNMDVINSYILNQPIQKLKPIILPSYIIEGGGRDIPKKKPKLITKPRPKLQKPLNPEKAPFPQKPIPKPRKKPIPKPRKKRPIPAPRKSKQEMKRLADIAKLRKDLLSMYTPQAIEAFRKKNKREMIKQRKSALKGFAKSYDVTIINDNDPAIQLYQSTPFVSDALNKDLSELKGLKVTIRLRVSMKKEKIDENGNVYFIFRDPIFPNTSPFILTTNYDTEEKIDKASNEINNIIAGWLSEGSGWVVDRVLNHYINVAKFDPYRPGSYIDLQKELKNSKKGLVNIKNKDDMCAVHNICRFLNPRKVHPERITKEDREFLKQFDLSGVEFPVQKKDIRKLEDIFRVNIFVYNYVDRKVLPLWEGGDKYDKTVDMLRITNEDREEGEEEREHLVFVQSFNSLMYNKTKHHDKQHYCRYCFHGLPTQRALELHTERCKKLRNNIRDNTRDKYPKPKEINGELIPEKLKFKNYKNKLPVPFVIYADFESLVEPISSASQNDEKSYTEKTAKNTPCSFGYKVVCHYDKKYSKPYVQYRGEDAIQTFIKEMFKEEYYCVDKVMNEFNKILVMTGEDEEKFKKEDKCHICEKKYKDDEKPVRDHCHVTGKYRGSAHNICNLNYKMSAKEMIIPVVFHNLKGYDGHLIMKELGYIMKRENEKINKFNAKVDVENKKIVEKNKEIYERNRDFYIKYPAAFEGAKKKKKNKKAQLELGVIPCTSEKYLSFSIDKLRFIDSFQFLASSLDELSQTLNDDEMEYTRDEFTDNEIFSILRKKGVYPYNYIDSFERFNERELPEKKYFYNYLTESHIKDEDYEHAKVVWDRLNIKNLGEYHDLYLKQDVLLLADVFEKFRKTSLNGVYGLDPAHYYSLPGKAWDCLLKYSGIELDLLYDPEMHQFIELGKRGGMSFISHRYAKANNPYIVGYDKDRDIHYLIYLDANNLYGLAMIHPMPYGGFKWVEDFPEKEMLPKVEGIGNIYEVDLEYPEELHDLHNEYPLAPEKMKITDDMLSDYAMGIKQKYRLPKSNVEKLVTTLYDKKNYIIHETNLKLYLELGLKIKKVHRVLQFDEKTWMKGYTELNTEYRKSAETKFEKDYYKLMNNAVFGKTIENVRKRCNVKLISDEEKFLKLTKSPYYDGCNIFSEDLVAVHMKKTEVLLNKPIYVGFSVLDISKVCMYDFHYNYIKKKYGDNAKLLFTDTDSLLYDIKTEDIYEDFDKDRDMFDNSDYPKDSKYFFDYNKKVIGKFKDETEGKPIISFIGLKSKMYDVLTENKKYDKMRAKGIKKYLKKNGLISHSDFENTLFRDKIMKHKMNCMRSDLHEIYCYKLNKTSLSCYDDKRYILDDKVSSLAYGHYKI